MLFTLSEGTDHYYDCTPTCMLFPLRGQVTIVYIYLHVISTGGQVNIIAHPFACYLRCLRGQITIIHTNLHIISIEGKGH